jgi:multiple sugar transport system permease protein
MSTTTVATRARGSRSSGKQVFVRILSYVLLFGLALLFLYPFFYALLASFKPLPEIAADPAKLWPETWTLDAYKALSTLNVPRWLMNSALIAVILTLSTVAFASLAGYALARIRFPGSRIVFLSLLGTMMVPGIVMLIPMFLVLKFLGLIDTYGGLILPKLVTAYGVFLMAQFFRSIPVELEEAARIDGANRFQTYFRVVLPLARAALIALTIATFQGSWNEFMHPLIVITVNQNLYTLPLGLALLRGNMWQNQQWTVFKACTMLATLPMALTLLILPR